MFPSSKKSAQFISIIRCFCCGFLFLFSLGSSISALQAENHYINQGDISKKWYVYSAKWKTYLPYVPSKHFSYQSKSLIFEGQKKYGIYLKLEPKYDLHLFINGVYQKNYQSSNLYLVNLDSLLLQHPIDKFIVFTLYSKQLKGLPDHVSQVVASQVNQVDQNGFLSVISRPSSVLDNFFFIGTLLVVFLYALIYRYFPRNFNFFFRIRDWLSFTYKEDAVVKTIFSFPNMVMLVCLSLLTGYVAFYHSFIDPTESEILKLGGEDVIWTEAVWFILSKSSLAFILFIGRYFVYVVFTNLFKIEILATPHFIKSIQTNIQFFSLLFFVLFFMYLIGGPSLHPDIELISIVVNIYFTLRMIYFFFLFKKTFHINNLTLLAYLLFMEGQVVIFGIRQLIFPNYI
ncbi:MAG: hypothetical protein RJA76_1515 [Bacteroidota bacterium]|jgi:hypothetical protein